MADRDPSITPSGPENETVIEEGNDGFATAFAEFAAGTAAKPGTGDEPDDTADQAGDKGRQEPPANAATDPQAKAPEQSAPGSPDPWANASPELIAERDRLIREANTERLRAQGAAGRASGLQRQLNALQSRPAPESSDQPDGKDKEGSAGAKALEDTIKRLDEEYPELAEMLGPVLKQQRDEIMALHGRVVPITEANDEAARQSEMQALEARHPDWTHYATIDGPEYEAFVASQPNAAEIRQTNANFRAWLFDQPEGIQALASSWDSKEVAAAISMFKTQQLAAMSDGGNGSGDGGKPAPKPNDTATDTRRQRQLDGGKEAGSKPAAVASGAPDGFSEAFEYYAAKRARKG